jgi:hypothetical protein
MIFFLPNAEHQSSSERVYKSEKVSSFDVASLRSFRCVSLYGMSLGYKICARILISSRCVV